MTEENTCDLLVAPRYIPDSEHSHLHNRAAMSEEEDYDEALRKAEDEYLAANLPDNLWSGVIKPGVTKKSDQLLVKFPFGNSEILNVEKVTPEMAKHGRRP